MEDSVLIHGGSGEIDCAFCSIQIFSIFFRNYYLNSGFVSHDVHYKIKNKIEIIKNTFKILAEHEKLFLY